MRISDWISDVCSSDLGIGAGDIGLLLDRVAEGNPVRAGALGQAEIDLADRGGVEVRPQLLQAADDGRLRIGLDGIEHARQRQQPLQLAVVMLDDVEIDRSEEHTSELQSLMRISYAVFCLKKK